MRQEILKEILDYDPLSGVFVWKVDRGPNKVAGKIAGHRNRLGYISIKINDKQHFAHRLAWIYVYGKEPSVDIDHRDKNPSNNQIENLRLAGPSLNGANRRLNINNRSGYKGVMCHRTKWRAYIKVNGKAVHLGDFSLIEDAIKARRSAELATFGGFS